MKDRGERPEGSGGSGGGAAPAVRLSFLYF